MRTSCELCHFFRFLVYFALILLRFPCLTGSEKSRGLLHHRNFTTTAIKPTASVSKLDTPSGTSNVNQTTSSAKAAVKSLDTTSKSQLPAETTSIKRYEKSSTIAAAGTSVTNNEAPCLTCPERVPVPASVVYRITVLETTSLMKSEIPQTAPLETSVIGSPETTATADYDTPPTTEETTTETLPTPILTTETTPNTTIETTPTTKVTTSPATPPIMSSVTTPITTSDPYPTPSDPSSGTPQTTGTETVPTPPSVPTTESPVKDVKVSCKKPNNAGLTTIYVDANDVYFEISTENETSVLVIIPSSGQTHRPLFLKLLYFSDFRNQPTQPITSSVTLIANLTHTVAYIFCVLPEDHYVETSPFNCRAHHLCVPVVAAPSAWLSSESQALFITLTILGVLVWLLIGAAAMYILLRWRPIWLKSNKRIRRQNANSKKILLYPKIKPSSPSKVQNEAEAADRASSSSALEGIFGNLQGSNASGSYITAANKQNFSDLYEKID